MIFMMPKWLVVKNQTNKNNKKDLRENSFCYKQGKNRLKKKK